MARQGVGIFSTSNTMLQNNKIKIKFPKAYDKTNYDKDPNAIEYEIRYIMQPIYCHAEGTNYIAIDDADSEIKTEWSLLTDVTADSGNENLLQTSITAPSAMTDVMLQYEIRALDDYDKSPNREIKSNRFFAIKNDAAKLKIIRMERVGEDEVRITGEVIHPGFSFPKNVEEIKESSELQTKFTSWRYDLGTIFGDVSFNFEYSHSDTMTIPNTRTKVTPSYKLRTWEWYKEPFVLSLTGFNKEENFFFKFYLTREGLLASSNSAFYNVVDPMPSIVVIQSGANSLQVANNGIRSNYPTPEDKTSTAAAMLVKGQQHNVPNKDYGHSAVLYDNTIPVGKTLPENKPSLGFLDMNHNELGSIGIESLFKPDGTNIGSYLVLRQEDSIMPVAIRSNGNRIQYWDEGLGIWQPILPAKMTKEMSEHIQWDLTGGETGNDPILIHMKGMTFSSLDGISFTTGSITPDSLSQELKDELSNRNLTLKASSYVYAVDSNDNPELNAYIDFTADLQGITGTVNWSFQGRLPNGNLQNVGSTSISPTSRRIQMSSLDKSILGILAKVSVTHNETTYEDSVEVVKIKHGADGEEARGIVNVTEWLLATTKKTGVTREDTGWTSSGYPTISKETPYLWNYKTTEYTDETYSHTEPALIGSFGADGRGISSVENFYVLSSLSEGVTISGYNWSTTPLSPTEDRPYLWNYDKINYHDGVNPTVVGPRVIGARGKDGVDGINGQPGEKGEQGPQGPQGPQGDQGVQGPQGPEGKATYTWIRYADTASGDGISNSPTGKEYIGLAHNKDTVTESNNPSDYTWSLIRGEQGNQGVEGPKGDDGVTTYTWIKYSANANGSGLTDTPQANTAYIGIATNKTSPDESDTPSDYIWSLFKGPKGDEGPQGATGERGPRGDVGTSVESVTEYYLASSSATGVTTGTSGWTTTMQGMTTSKRYLWNYERIHFSDETHQDTIPVVVGVHGATGGTGPKGDEGDVGRSIVSITEHYLATASESGVTRSTSGWSTTMQTTDDTKKYLWNYETITWNKAPLTTYVAPIIIGVHGAKGPQGPQGDRGPQGATGDRGPKGDTGTSVESVTEYYLATSASSGVTTGTSGWKTTIQTMTATNKYLWNYEKINFSDGTSQPTIPVIIGVYGDKGQTGSTGATGRSITAIQENYLATSASSGVTRNTSGWTTTMQTTTPTKKYLWNYETITWSSGTSPTYVDPIIIGVHGEQGPQGEQGPRGATGSQGPRGNDGTSVSSITEYYLATSASSGVTTSTSGWGTTLQPITTSKKYLWNYEKINFSDGTSQNTIPVIIGVYGDTGNQGPQGPEGEVGRSITGITEHYLISASSSGVTRSTSGWSTTMKATTETLKYLWNYETITWNKAPFTTYVDPIIIGVHGAQGPQGTQGPKGDNGQSQYTHIRYSANASGSGMTTSPGSTTKYIGIAVTNSATAPAYGSFTWSKYIGDAGVQGPQGPQGIQGIQGPAGANGQPTYTWVKYAEDKNGKGMSDYPEGKRFIGLAFNKLTATESTTASHYQWSEMPQNIEIGGRNYLRRSDLTSDAETLADGSILDFSKTSTGTFALFSGLQLEKGKYIYHIMMRKPAGDSVASIRFHHNNVTVSYYGRDPEVDGEWNRLEIPFEVTDESDAYGSQIYNHAFGADFAETVEVMHPMIEKGNTVTDWTPAPEDTQSEIDETKEQVKKTVKTITEEYYQSTSATSQTGGAWTETAPTWQEGKFIFIRSKITYVDGTTDYTPIVNITGAKGDTGSKGDAGPRGPEGPRGLPGTPGEDGTTSYLHIRYAEELLGRLYPYDDVEGEYWYTQTSPTTWDRWSMKWDMSGLSYSSVNHYYKNADEDIIDIQLGFDGTELPMNRSDMLVGILYTSQDELDKIKAGENGYVYVVTTKYSAYMSSRSYLISGGVKSYRDRAVKDSKLTGVTIPPLEAIGFGNSPAGKKYMGTAITNSEIGPTDPGDYKWANRFDEEEFGRLWSSLAEAEQNFSSQIKTTNDSISSSVESITQWQSDYGDIIASHSSSIEQFSEEVVVHFESLLETVSDLKIETDKITSYIHLGTDDSLSPEISMGKSDSPYKLNLHLENGLTMTRDGIILLEASGDRVVTKRLEVEIIDLGNHIAQSHGDSVTIFSPKGGL